MKLLQLFLTTACAAVTQVKTFMTTNSLINCNQTSNDTIDDSTNLEELAKFEANARFNGPSSDLSLNIIEFMIRYYISYVQGNGATTHYSKYQAIMNSASMKATVKEMLEYGCWGQVLTEIPGKRMWPTSLLISF